MLSLIPKLQPQLKPDLSSRKNLLQIRNKQVRMAYIEYCTYENRPIFLARYRHTNRSGTSRTGALWRPADSWCFRNRNARRQSSCSHHGSAGFLLSKRFGRWTVHYSIGHVLLRPHQARNIQCRTQNMGNEVAPFGGNESCRATAHCTGGRFTNNCSTVQEERETSSTDCAEYAWCFPKS